MSSPCPRCGETRTDSVMHGAVYKLVWAFGYRLRQCSRCRTRRFIPRHRGKSRGSSQEEKEPLGVPSFAEERSALGTAEARAEPREDRVTPADSSDRELYRCPACGSRQYHRSRRTKLEHLLSRPPMARCEECMTRFPYPGPHEKCPDPLKWGGAAATVPRSAGERSVPGMAEESSPWEVDEDGTAADDSNGEVSCCPVCDSTSYRRSRRTTWEHFLLRPKMARCQRCWNRFPYPKR